MKASHDPKQPSPQLPLELDAPAATSAPKTPEKPSIAPTRAARLRRIARNGNRAWHLLEALYKDLLDDVPERYRGQERALARMGDARGDLRNALERAEHFVKSSAEYAENTLKAVGEPVVIERKRPEPAVPESNPDNSPTLMETFGAEALTRDDSAEPWGIGRL